MKKSVMEALHTYANTDPNFPADLRDEVNAEYDRTTAKSRANADLYAAAHDALFSADGWDTPMTAQELADTFANVLPEGFTKSKIQYALRVPWANEVDKHDNGKNPYTYMKK